MISNFQIIHPHPLLKNYIERIFVIESSGKLPTNDLKLIVPNACAKLVIPFKNGLIGKTAQWEHLTKENQIAFIGISDIPAIVDYERDEPAGNITVEFSPLGAYRFFNLKWTEIKNKIFHYSDLSHEAHEIEQKLADSSGIPDKLKTLQRFLLDQLLKMGHDPVFDFCVQQIMATKGKVSISSLQKSTGYSARWLNMKFHDKVGVSPKNLASIIRFQQYYQSVASNSEASFLKHEFYNYYYDQSHFIKDFKRFTGLAPSQLERGENDYDRVFYRG